MWRCQKSDDNQAWKSSALLHQQVGKIPRKKSTELILNSLKESKPEREPGMTMESEKEPNLHVGENETCCKNSFFFRITKDEEHFFKTSSHIKFENNWTDWFRVKPENIRITHVREMVEGHCQAQRPGHCFLEQSWNNATAEEENSCSQYKSGKANYCISTSSKLVLKQHPWDCVTFHRSCTPAMQNSGWQSPALGWKSSSENPRMVWVGRTLELIHFQPSAVH